MALNSRCDKGHPIIIPDIIEGDLPEGMSLDVALCDECRKEWEAQQKTKDELKIEDLQRVRLAPGDVLVVRYEGIMPASSIEQIHIYLQDLFPNNKVVLCHKGIELAVIEANA